MERINALNPTTTSYRNGDFIVHDHGHDWKVRFGEGNIEKHGDGIVAEMISFSTEHGAKFAVMYQFPNEKILIEL